MIPMVGAPNESNGVIMVVSCDNPGKWPEIKPILLDRGLFNRKIPYS